MLQKLMPLRKDFPKERLATQLIKKFPSLVESDDSLPFLGGATLISHINPIHIFLSDYEGHLESKERFAIQRYLLITGKKQNMQVLSHTFTYFST